MNERIRELMKQARDWGYAEHHGHTAQLLFEQKFAELIVEEMHDFIMDEVGNDNGIPDLGKIKQHFGVES